MFKHDGISNQHDINENLISSDCKSKDIHSKLMELTEKEPFPFQNDVLAKLTTLQKIQVFIRVILNN